MEMAKKKKIVSFQLDTKQDMVCHGAQNVQSLKRKREAGDCSSSSSVVMSSAMERAEEIRAKLAPAYPTMIKLMMPSHVSGCFWLGLSKHFCDSHMPKEDGLMILEDENGDEFKTIYLNQKTGLSGGWRGFSNKQKLMQGDVLVFHLVEPTRFKVYIVRSKNIQEVHGAPAGHLKLEASTTQTEDENETKLDLHIAPAETNIDDHGMGEILEAIRFSDASIPDLKEVTNPKSYIISVHGLVIDSEISIHVRRKYYELCKIQNTFLHENLIEGLNCKLVAGMIMETVNISDAIKASRVSTSPEHFTIWDKTLKAFEDMGMNVGFLRAKLEKLLGIGSESKKRREDGLRRVAEASEELQKLQDKLWEVRESAKRVDAEIEKLMVTSRMHDLMFRQEIEASW